MGSSSESERELKPTVSAASVAGMYDQHAASLRVYILGIVGDRSLADDVVQQTFTKLQLEFDKGNREIHAGWLYRVASNEAIQIRRQQSRQRKHLPFFSQLEQQTQRDDQDFLISAESAEIVQKALSELPDELKEIVQARIYQDLKFREIADKLNLPLGTVLTRMSRALKSLREALKTFEE